MFGGATPQERARSKHRFKQLKRIRRNQGIRTTIARMTSLTTTLAVSVAACISAAFITSQSVLTNLEGNVDLVSAAAERAALLQQIAFLARSLQLASVLNDNSTAAIGNAALLSATNRATNLHNFLYLGVSDSPIASHYLSPVIEIQRYIGTDSPPSYQTQKYGFWDAANMYLAAANMLVAPVGSSERVAGALDASMLLDGGNVTMRDSVAWRFVMDNTGVVVAHAITSAELELEFVEGLVEVLAGLQIGAYAFLVTTILLLVQFVLRPMYAKLSRERSSMFGLFGLLPRKVTLDLASMRLRVGRADGGGDDADSDSSASENSSDSEDDNAQYGGFSVPKQHVGGPAAPPTAPGDIKTSLALAARNSQAQSGRRSSSGREEMLSTGKPTIALGHDTDNSGDESGRPRRGSSSGVPPVIADPSDNPSVMGSQASYKQAGRYRPKGMRGSKAWNSNNSLRQTTDTSDSEADAVQLMAGGSPCALCMTRWKLVIILSVKLAISSIFAIIGPLLTFRRPVSTPRKLGYSVLALLGLLSINLAVSRTELLQARSGILHSHYDDRVSTFFGRIRFLAQEMAFLDSPGIRDLQPQPAPAPNVLSTNPSIAALRLGMRSAVSLAQRNVDALLSSAVVTKMPGTGDGFLDMSFLAEVSLTAFAAESAELVFENAHPDSTIDEVNKAALQSAFFLSDSVTSKLLHVKAADLDDLMDNPLASPTLLSTEFKPSCLRTGGTILGPEASAIMTHKYKQSGQDTVSPTVLVYPLNYSFPVIIPADTYNCLPASNPMAPYLNNGFDVAVRSVLQQAWLFANETQSVLVPWNHRYRFIQSASQLELSDACELLRSEHVDVAKTSLKLLHLSETIIFVLCIMLSLTWYFALLRPYISHLSFEMSRVAALLSFLPASIDLQKLIKIHDQRRQVTRRR